MVVRSFELKNKLVIDLLILNTVVVALKTYAILATVVALVALEILLLHQITKNHFE